ncbi:MAG: Ig-like domain-containing protein [Ferruginibacter sp.]
MKNRLLLGIMLMVSTVAFSQPQFPCTGDFLFTRQFTPSPNTYLSKVNFAPGDITITNPGTLTPAQNTNASVQYNGYVWTQIWNGSTFTLLRVAADYSYTQFAVAAMPANVNYNNAGVDKNGLMYILKNGNNPVSLYTINLSSGTPTFVSTKTVTGLPSTTDAVTWGDITIDPTNNRVYCWYHPSPAPATNVVGLYELTNISTATPTLVKIGGAQAYTMGSLFFNDRGELFGYGSSTLGSNQDRIFAINKTTGAISQFGIPDLAVSQSDGCECSFRLGLDRQASVPVLNIQKCGLDSFDYTFTVRNYTVAAITNITFSDTLDSRISYTTQAAALQTQLRTVYGTGATVAITSFGSGINNVINVTGMNIPTGTNIFNLTVRVDANRFSAPTTIYEQAYLKGVSVILGGPNEPSNNPNTYSTKDATPISINFNGSKCLPPLASNFINTPMPQGNAATAIPGLVASDPDGAIASFNVLTIPAAAAGVLSVPCPPNIAGGTCTGGFTNLTSAVLSANPSGIPLTPAQAGALRFDPVFNYTGNAAFTFNAIDNSGTFSNTATYTLPVTAQPPVSVNIMENSIPNTNGATSIQGLNSSDVDGTISSYHVLTLPTAAQGVLSVPCPPNLTGGTCTAGYVTLTATVLGNYPSGIPLTATQIAAFKFAPNAAYTGNATFNYNATDNSGNISNTANYTIPVSATATIVRPPLAENIFAQSLNNSVGATVIPSLSATDLDGSVTSFTITSVPTAAQGILSVSCPPNITGGTCTGGFTDLTPAVLAANPGGIVLNTTQATSLRFDPVATFTGTTTFNYTAKDNSGLLSNIASYTIPVVNVSPTAVNINTSVPPNSTVVGIRPLSGSDADGTITNFVITTLPTAAQGTLSVSCPPNITGATCTGGFTNLTPAVLAANPGGISLTPAQAISIRFAPATGFSGVLSYNYNSIDNNGNVSNPAVYTISISNVPPVANDVTVAAMPNTNGATSLSSLSATDADGTISSYTITSLPPTASGILSLSGTATTVGQVLTPAQVSLLKFDPAINYTGLVTFNYTATDNAGSISNNANYNIPISGVGNLPPVANNIYAAAMLNTNGATAIPSLSGTDPDGTVANYTITSLPSANEGVLSMPCPPTPVGGTCTGGFVNLTAAVLAANPNGIVLNAAQIAGLRFDPTAGFGGTSSFTYFNTDNSGVQSNIANYTIPVTGFQPVANPVIAPAMPLSNSATAIPGLQGFDVDGTVVSYTIDIVPPTSEGVLSISCPATPIGATCTGGFADLTPAVLAANFGGIVITPAQMATLRFDPSGTYTGNVIFNYHVTDNAGLTSNTATYIIPVTGLNPVSTDVIAPKLVNSSGPTSIPGLNSSDADGTISSYLITSVPPANQGVISVPCPPIPNGATCTGGFASLTSAVLIANPGGIILTPTQIAGLQFTPVATYNGNVIFNYAAFDNSNNLSNTANYIIPVGTASVLPLSKLDFTGVRSGNNIVLRWVSENEINLNRYEVEYSTNNIQFTKYDNVAAKNLYNNSYGSTLFNLTQPVYYLRLKVINQNGVYNYSNTIVLKSRANELITVYPTPGNTFVNIQFADDSKGNYQLTLFDAAGKIIREVVAKNIAPSQVVKLERGNIASGTYILQIANQATNKREVRKVIFE